MKIICVYFGGLKYERLAAALEQSVAINMPNVEIVMIEGEQPSRYVKSLGRELSAFKSYNTYKLGIWRKCVNEYDEPLILMDADTLLTQSIEHVFDRKFDMAITERVQAKGQWFNGGVIFIRPNANSRKLMDMWVEKNDYLFNHPRALNKVHEKYQGMNQAAFLSMLEEAGLNGGLPCKIIKLPAVKYNCCQCCWEMYQPGTTAIIHIKGIFRELIWGNCRPEKWPEHLHTVAAEWFKYDVKGPSYDKPSDS